MYTYNTAEGRITTIARTQAEKADYRRHGECEDGAAGSSGESGDGLCCHETFPDEGSVGCDRKGAGDCVVVRVRSALSTRSSSAVTDGCCERLLSAISFGWRPHSSIIRAVDQSLIRSEYWPKGGLFFAGILPARFIKRLHRSLALRVCLERCFNDLCTESDCI